MFGQKSLDALAAWQRRLEEQYVRLALQAAHYEEDHQLASFHDLYIQMDRLEEDIVRARKAVAMAEKNTVANIERAAERVAEPV